MSLVKRSIFLFLLAVTTFSILLGLTAEAQANPEANKPDYWCEEGFKVEWDGDVRVYVADSDYALVVIKAGVENYTFVEVRKGDSLEVPKGISHIIFCGATVGTTTTTEPPTTTTVPEETTTTVGTTTTVKEEPSTTTSTIGTATTNQVVPSSTSTTPPTESTSTPTTGVTTTTVTPVKITELPFTGMTWSLLPLSIIALSTGMLILRSTRDSN